MARNRRWGLAFSVAAVLAVAGPAGALPLNKDGTIKLNVRTYVNVRVGTKAKQSTRPSDPDSFGGTFPFVGAGNVLQNRYFLDVKWRHDLLPVLRDILPKGISDLEYLLEYRGEYEGIYDFGPKAFTHNTESLQEIQEVLRRSPTLLPQDVPRAAQEILSQKRHRLRQVASFRNRLFQAFIDLEWGDLFVRFGRQNLVWGETDIFRLLDNINPIDNSFGGFFIDLDERRVPLNMLRTSYYLGSLGPLDQTFVEGYVAYDNTVAFIPGAPAGSPWSVPLGPPGAANPGNLIGPCTCPDNVRGGGRIVTNIGDFTFTLASYFTMLDVQAVRFVRPDPNLTPGFVQGATVVEAQQFAPRVWINGASMTTAFPKLQGVLRSEIAWFRDEAFFRGPTPDAFPGQGLTPEFIANFLQPVLNQSRDGGLIDPTKPGFDTVYRTDTLNLSVGWDMNQFIRFLNPRQSFLFSTQFFWKHIFDFDPQTAFPVPEPNNSLRTVPRVEDQFLQTFLVNTTYNTRIPFTNYNIQTTPGLAMFYDWQGMVLFQPSLRFVRDPWRFIVDYTTIDSGVFRGEIGFVRDRSNVRVQLEYVL